MLRVMELRTDRVELFEGSEQVGVPPADVVRWVDLSEPDASELELVRQRFDFHPVAIEDCARLDLRPKLEEYRDHVFLVTQGFAAGESAPDELELQELHTFLGERYIVTVHQQPIDALERAWTRLTAEPSLFARGAYFVYYLVIDRIVDDNFPILDRIADELEELEDSVLTSPRPDDLPRMFALKRRLVTMRKVLSPQRDVLGLLSKYGDPRLDERSAVYLRSVYDHLVRINESIETNRDLLSNTLDAYLSVVAQRTNEIMKYLTLMSAVFLPLAFVVGFFGQNFDNLPFLKDWVHSDGLMWAMVVICLALPVAMLGWFKHKRWL